MRVVVTGSTSAIGKKIIQLLKSKGMSVIELGGKNSELWRLGRPLPKDLQADTLIHLAHDRKLSLEENNTAIDLLVESFKGYKILISSLSSHSKTESKYGLSKRYAEERFLEKNGVCLRVGLVYGTLTGGVYQTLRKSISKFPVLPLPFDGKPRFFFSHIDDLTSEILHFVQTKQRGLVFAANYWPHSLRDIVERLAQDLGRNCYLIGVNTATTRLLLKVTKLLGIKVALLDSLKSLEHEISNSELGALQIPNTRFRSFNEELWI